MTQDEQNLDLLGIFHYVVGGMTALFSCMFFLHLALGIAILSGKMDGKPQTPAVLGWLFVIIPSVFILCGWTLSTVMFLAGRRLRQRRSRTFCFVVGCMECILMPFGTVLGVFTLVHLNKESVQQLFRA